MIPTFPRQLHVYRVHVHPCVIPGDYFLIPTCTKVNISGLYLMFEFMNRSVLNTHLYHKTNHPSLVHIQSCRNRSSSVLVLVHKCDHIVHCQHHTYLMVKIISTLISYDEKIPAGQIAIVICIPYIIYLSLLWDKFE